MNMSDLSARSFPRPMIVPGGEHIPSAAPLHEMSRFFRRASAGLPAAAGFPGALASQKDGSSERRAHIAARPIIDTVAIAPMNCAAMLARIPQIAAAADRPATA